MTLQEKLREIFEPNQWFTAQDFAKEAGIPLSDARTALSNFDLKNAGGTNRIAKFLESELQDEKRHYRIVM